VEVIVSGAFTLNDPRCAPVRTWDSSLEQNQRSGVRAGFVLVHIRLSLGVGGGSVGPMLCLKIEHVKNIGVGAFGGRFGRMSKCDER
jgi:hypothetical protein